MGFENRSSIPGPASSEISSFLRRKEIERQTHEFEVKILEAYETGRREVLAIARLQRDDFERRWEELAAERAAQYEKEKSDGMA